MIELSDSLKEVLEMLEDDEAERLVQAVLESRRKHPSAQYVHGVGLCEIVVLRLLAVIAFIIAVILFVVVAIGTNVDPTVVDWGFVSLAAGLACFALEGVAIPRGPT